MLRVLLPNTLLLYRKLAFIQDFVSCTFHNPNLILRQPVQLVHQLVDHFVRRRDLALEQGLFRGGVRGGELAVQVEHGLDERDHVVMPGGTARGKKTGQIRP
jgi:hypothetical protein